MVSSFEEVPARDRVIVALDCGIEEAFDLADQLQGKATWMKVGMTLFYANGPAIVYALVMNVVLLSYLKLLPKCTDETASEGA